jgi:single-strand DNA-binding protein
MANFNKVILMGNLTRDPQLSYLPNQTPVCEIGMAINRRWKGNDGQQKEETCYVDCQAYGRQAETLNQYMTKGRPLLIEGRLRYSQWEDKDGNKRSKLRVMIDTFQFLGQGQGGGQGGGQNRPASGGGGGGFNAPQSGGGNTNDAPPAMPDDFGAPGGEDIPF